VSLLTVRSVSRPFYNSIRGSFDIEEYV